MVHLFLIIISPNKYASAGHILEGFTNILVSQAPTFSYNYNIKTFQNKILCIFQLIKSSMKAPNPTLITGNKKPVGCPFRSSNIIENIFGIYRTFQNEILS